MPASLSELEQTIADFIAKPRPLRLQGVVQHYPWGGYEFIPSLLGISNDTRQPYAELWLGAHPKARALVSLAPCSPDRSGSERRTFPNQHQRRSDETPLQGNETSRLALPLDQLLDRAAITLLGPKNATRFAGQLPYLFKVLDARQMLSLQAHPSKRAAEEGYAREEACGIPLQASNRNYKDRNHKPEIHVALTDFWMLHGFRPLEDIATTFRAIPHLQWIMPHFLQRVSDVSMVRAGSPKLLQEVYESLMTMPQDKVDAILNPILTRLRQNPPTDKNHIEYWIMRAAEQFPLPAGHYDRGLLALYLLNLVHLRPGQGTFQPAGTLHAYLEGVNVELMANSDNVLRGGLTTKHVEVPELLRTLDFSSTRPQILAGDGISSYETVYRTPAEEFALSRVQLPASTNYLAPQASGPDTLILLEGSVSVVAADCPLYLHRGQAVFSPFGVPYSLHTHGEPALLFKASYPNK